MSSNTRTRLFWSDAHVARARSHDQRYSLCAHQTTLFMSCARHTDEAQHARGAVFTLQVERLQRKFAGIHSTLAQQHAMGGASMKASEFAERMSLMSLADSTSLSALGARLRSRRRDTGVDQGPSESPSPVGAPLL